MRIDFSLVFIIFLLPSPFFISDVIVGAKNNILNNRRKFIVFFFKNLCEFMLNINTLFGEFFKNEIRKRLRKNSHKVCVYKKIHSSFHIGYYISSFLYISAPGKFFIFFFHIMNDELIDMGYNNNSNQHQQKH